MASGRLLTAVLIVGFVTANLRVAADNVGPRPTDPNEDAALSALAKADREYQQGQPASSAKTAQRLLADQPN